MLIIINIDNIRYQYRYNVCNNQDVVINLMKTFGNSTTMLNEGSKLNPITAFTSSASFEENKNYYLNNNITLDLSNVTIPSKVTLVSEYKTIYSNGIKELQVNSLMAGIIFKTEQIQVVDKDYTGFVYTNNGQIVNCSVQKDLIIKENSSVTVNGFVNINNGVILSSTSYADTDFNNQTITYNGFVGTNNGIIKHCLSNAVLKHINNESVVSGFVNINTKTIEDCYSANSGVLDGVTTDNKFGFVTTNNSSVTNCSYDYIAFNCVKLNDIYDATTYDLFKARDSKYWANSDTYNYGYPSIKARKASNTINASVVNYVNKYTGSGLKADISILIPHGGILDYLRTKSGNVYCKQINDINLSIYGNKFVTIGSKYNSINIGDLKGSGIFPIGFNSSNKTLNIYYEGNNYSIFNLNNITTGSNQNLNYSLFDTVETVNNLALSITINTGSKRTNTVAGLAASLSQKISNCIVDVNIKTSVLGNPGGAVGGIIGKASSGEIVNCIVTGQIILTTPAQSYAAGIVGLKTGSSLTSLKITNCYSAVSISNLNDNPYKVSPIYNTATTSNVTLNNVYYDENISLCQGNGININFDEWYDEHYNGINTFSNGADTWLYSYYNLPMLTSFINNQYVLKFIGYYVENQNDNMIGTGSKISPYKYSFGDSTLLALADIDSDYHSINYIILDAPQNFTGLQLNTATNKQTFINFNGNKLTVANQNTYVFASTLNNVVLSNVEINVSENVNYPLANTIENSVRYNVIYSITKETLTNYCIATDLTLSSIIKLTFNFDIDYVEYISSIMIKQTYHAILKDIVLQSSKTLTNIYLYDQQTRAPGSNVGGGESTPRVINFGLIASEMTFSFVEGVDITEIGIIDIYSYAGRNNIGLVGGRIVNSILYDITMGQQQGVSIIGKTTGIIPDLYEDDIKIKSFKPNSYAQLNVTISSNVAKQLHNIGSVAGEIVAVEVGGIVAYNNVIALCKDSDAASTNTASYLFVGGVFGNITGEFTVTARNLKQSPEIYLESISVSGGGIKRAASDNTIVRPILGEIKYNLSRIGIYREVAAVRGFIVSNEDVELQPAMKVNSNVQTELIASVSNPLTYHALYNTTSITNKKSGLYYYSTGVSGTMEADDYKAVQDGVQLPINNPERKFPYVGGIAGNSNININELYNQYEDKIITNMPLLVTQNIQGNSYYNGEPVFNYGYANIVDSLNKTITTDIFQVQQNIQSNKEKDYTNAIYLTRRSVFSKTNTEIATNYNIIDNSYSKVYNYGIYSGILEPSKNINENITIYTDSLCGTAAFQMTSWGADHVYVGSVLTGRLGTTYGHSFIPLQTQYAYETWPQNSIEACQIPNIYVDLYGIHFRIQKISTYYDGGYTTFETFPYRNYQDFIWK